MEKLVVKKAVKTVLIILGIVLVVFAVFNFAFPQHMATVTESMGNYTLAVKYASMRYSQTKDCADLARCFDDSVLLGDDKYILQYGEELVSHMDYDAVCKLKNEEYSGAGFDYNHRVNAKMAVSYYNTGKTAEAIALAVEDNGYKSFEYGNALMSLAARIKTEKDAEAAKAISDELDKITPSAEKPDEERYLTEVKKAMTAIAGNG